MYRLHKEDVFDLSDNHTDFIYSTNNKFFRFNINGEDFARPNLDVLIEDMYRYQNKLNFMELNTADSSSNYEFLSTKVRHNESNNNSHYCSSWTLLGSCTAYKDRIYVNDHIKNYLSIVESFIIYLDDEYYYLEKVDSYQNFIFFKIRRLILIVIDAFFLIIIIRFNCYI
jgi:hypothetical protein